MSFRVQKYHRAGIAALVLAGLAFASATFAGDPPHGEKSGVSPASALNRLVEGNRRFVRGKLSRPNDDPARIKELAGGQHPLVTVLSCSDSRVPPELVSDQGLGDVFMVRVAGNTADPTAIGSIEYATAHLDSPLIVVMGHEKCGAVTGALDAKNGTKDSISGIAALLDGLVPFYDKVDSHLSRDAQIHAGIEANVQRTVAQLKELPELRHLLISKGVWVIGAVYNISTGQVRFLPVQN